VNFPKKWLFVLLAVFFIGSIFAEKIVGLYVDFLWFAKHGLSQVLWTVLGAQTGLGVAAGGLMFAVTYGTLRGVYRRSSHLPVRLSDQVRQEMPFLDLLASNLGPLLFVGPLVLSVMTGLVLADRWETVLLFLNAVPFGEADPAFGKDYSFYLLTLPFWVLCKGLLWEALVVISLGVGLIYFFKRFIFFGPHGLEVLPEGRRTLSTLAGMFFLLFASEFYLERYTLLTEGNGVVAGISYADDHGRLPALFLLSVLALVGAGISFLGGAKQGLRRVFIAAAGVGVVYMVGNFYPGLLQKFVVTPNELIKETPYIERTIQATLKGFNLDRVETRELTGSASLTAEHIKDNSPTIENIRLWDAEPLLDTLGQLQEIRTYYQFNSVDNDRYRIDGTYRQTLLSPRELLSSSLPNRTWINEHLTFTHGYGVSLSPVNEVTPEGLPVLLIKDIPPSSTMDLKVERPEIYFGELANDNVFVNTGTKEFDYPEGEKNVYKNYEGEGGFEVSSLFRKAILAARFKTLKILFSNDITNESRVLMYRNIRKRVEKTAPFLGLDRDPYMVISEGRLVWMIDAYTRSDKFPYSQMIAGYGNYVRNSVKVTIDAYDGTMRFYVFDEKDPIILTYRKIFPTLFSDRSEMPKDLAQHVRYPSDLFSIQTIIHATYHMKTPQVFYNKEDQWEIPEIDGKFMQPYYTIMKLPGKEREEYILMLPFTPRGKSNLSAWMVARSDGEHYGKLEIYQFPKQKLVYGPNQIVARINQDAEISRQISLWDQRGSSVIQGNLLVIPIEESLIYVRPLYLKADAGKIPELKRVIVGYEDNIAMEPTLDEALQKIFGGLFAAAPDVGKDGKDGAPGVPPSEAPQLLGRVVLGQTEYQEIRKRFERIRETQNQLDRSLADYRDDLDALGKALSSAEVLEDKKPVPVQDKKPEPPAPAVE